MTVKTFIMLQNIIFQINAVLLNFLFIKVSWKKKHTKLTNKYWCQTKKNLSIVSYRVWLSNIGASVER